MNKTQDPRLQKALCEAIEDEYKARATYRAVVARFGALRPFTNILNSEERHVRALLPLFRRYGIPVPVDRWAGAVVPPDSLAEACREGVRAEIENGDLYRRLLAATAAYPDVQQVFRQLQWASQVNHLRAFERCAARTSGDRQSNAGGGCGRDVQAPNAVAPQIAGRCSGGRRARRRRCGRPRTD